MATTSPDNLRTPDPGSSYNLVSDLATLAGDVQSALNTRANTYKGTATQRTSFTSTAVPGMLWQDTDGIRMIWKRGASAWEPAIWRWVGTTAQMNAFSQAPNGFEWYNTTDNKTYLRESGAWTIWGQTGLIASGTISGLSTFNIDGLVGANRYEVTLILPSSSVANDILIRVRNNGATDSTSNYDRQSLVGANTVAAATNAMGQNVWGGVVTSSRTDKNIRLLVSSLNQPERTIVEVQAEAWNATSDPYVTSSGLRHRSATSFNGLWFQTTTGTVTGRYEVRAS